jgi:hypothetical protein
MGKKKSPKVLIVGDNSELHKMLAEQEIFFAHKPITISHCKKALKVASRHPSYFDFLKSCYYGKQNEFLKRQRY